MDMHNYKTTVNSNIYEINNNNNNNENKQKKNFDLNNEMKQKRNNKPEKNIRISKRNGFDF